MRAHGWAALLAAMLVVTGCQSPTVYVGPREDADFERGGRIDYTSTECGAQVLLLLPVFTNRRFERAMRQIQAATPGRFISDVRIRESWMYGVFATLHCTEVIAATWPERK